MTAPANSAEVVRHLGELTRDLRALTEQYKTAEVEAAKLRHTADMCKTRAWLHAAGTVPEREHKAREAADTAEGEALVAEAIVRGLRADIRMVETRIDVGRTFGATVRAELRTLGLSGEGA